MKNTTNLLKALIREVLLLEDEAAAATPATTAPAAPAAPSGGKKKKRTRASGKRDPKIEKLNALKLELAKQLGMSKNKLRKSPTGKLLTQALNQLLKKDKLKIEVEPDPAKATSGKAPDSATPDKTAEKTTPDAAPATSAPAVAPPSAPQPAAAGTTASPENASGGVDKDKLTEELIELFLSKMENIKNPTNLLPLLDNLKNRPNVGMANNMFKKLIGDGAENFLSNRDKINWDSVSEAVKEKLKDASKEGSARPAEEAPKEENASSDSGDIPEKIKKTWNEVYEKFEKVPVNEKRRGPDWTPLKNIEGIKDHADGLWILEQGDTTYVIPVGTPAENYNQNSHFYEFKESGVGKPVMKKIASMTTEWFKALYPPGKGTVNKGEIEIPSKK